MFWFFVGLILYFFVTLAERALVSLSPHELEQLGLDDSPAAQRIYHLGQEGVRPALAALLLARLLLQVCLVVFAVSMFFGSDWLRIALAAGASQAGWPEWVLWGLAAVCISILLGLAFWIIQKIDIQGNSSTRATFVVQRLAYFIYFWKILFSPLLGREIRAEASAAEAVKEM